MNWQWTPYAIPLFLGAAISTAGAIYILWQRRYSRRARIGALLLLASAAWVLGSALELSSADLASKIVWDKLQLLGICIIPTAWLAYTLRHTGHEQVLILRNQILLSILPLITFLLALTNEAHGLIWRESWLDTSGPLAVKRTIYGLGLWAYTAYAYALMFVGFGLLLAALVRSGRLYRWQAGAMLVTVLTPWLLNTAEYLFGWTAFGNVKLTPFALGVTVPILGWSFYRLQLRDIVPVARQTVIERMGDALVILDIENRVIDLNETAEHLLGQARSEALEQPVERLFPEWPGWVANLHDRTEAVQEVMLSHGDEQRTYHLRISPLTDWRGQPVSRVVVLHDVTELKRRTEELATMAIENARLYQGAQREIAERRRAEAELREAYNIIRLSPAVAFLWGNDKGWPVEYVTDNVEAVFGYTSEEFISGRVLYSEIIHPDDLERVDREVVTYSQEEGRHEFVHQPYRIVTKDGKVRWLDDRTSIRRDKTGRITHYQGVVLDITERKQAEEQLQVSLREKEVLLQEIHHRVKNNLQVISSLLELQADSVGDLQVHQMFQDSHSRIRAMGLIHERLYRSKDMANIDAAGYIRDLVAHLFGIYASPARIVRSQVRVSEITLGLDTAIPCGLILTELVSNALKHAFPPESDGGGEIHVELCTVDDGWLDLIVGDDGVGLPPDLDWRAPQSLGLQLVNMLGRQLGGTVELDRSGGTTFRIRFPHTSS